MSTLKKAKHQTQPDMRYDEAAVPAASTSLGGGTGALSVLASALLSFSSHFFRCALRAAKARPAAVRSSEVDRRNMKSSVLDTKNRRYVRTQTLISRPPRPTISGIPPDAAGIFVLDKTCQRSQ
ncbi:hypothetical protein A0H81_02633 [Grifola frondosa]|uniref:Uncharacterized protein n=1 Tax=Grifola frondosa TaxID=5627 RepID=A0A1C7MNA7_GRIFR|nr:hypothetical protein A0H81_02633 [Grifola frondosa]